MNTLEIVRTLATLMRELLEGAKASESSYMLNGGDVGLLASLDHLSAEAASTSRDGGASIAAHTDHLRYGLSLMNRWAAGEKPFGDAEWSTSWRTRTVSDDEWSRLRAELRREGQQWIEVLGQPRDVSEVELNGMVSSIAHLAYHLGAIRQIDRDARGPGAND
ncbi:MAG: hypothetical protein JWO05_2989 [Gemmatimonadetes bacterium]|nr:hypothetical protein [Gemmatimonadota bacterium]